jgi:hypothetical protein
MDILAPHIQERIHIRMLVVVHYNLVHILEGVAKVLDAA